MSSDDASSSDEEYVVPGKTAAAAPAAIQTIVLTGLPGVGRTTLLDHLLDTLPDGARPAVVVHRFSPGLGINDAPEVHGVALGTKENLALYADVFDFGSGASCCSPNGALARELRQLGEAAAAPTHLFVETTGMADPSHFARLLGSPEFAAGYALRAIVCVVSARDYAALQPGQPMHARGLSQLRIADMVLVNNVDDFDAGGHAEEAYVQLRQMIALHCPPAAQVLRKQAISRTNDAYTNFGWLDLDSELPAGSAGANRAASSPRPQALSSEALAKKFEGLLAASMTVAPPQLGAPPGMTAPRLSTAVRKATPPTASAGGAQPPPLPQQVKRLDLKAAAPPLPNKKPATLSPRTPGGSPAVSTNVPEDSTAPPKHADDGHDHDAEHAAAKLEAETKLLPPPPEVVLWTDGKYEKHDEDVMRIQGVKAVRWLVQALLAAWCSDELKTQGRRLLAVRAFTANLRFMHLWHETPTAGQEMKQQTVLMTPIKAKLKELGHILEENYNEDNLKKRLGSLTLPLHPLIAGEGGGEARQGLCVPNPPPEWHGQPHHRCEFAYLHVLIMLAGAVNEAFQDWCRETLGDTISELQTPPIKSYGRMRNKMFSADDHRFRPSPRDDPKRARPESNVDINRVLAVAHSPESMAKAAQLLSDTGGGVAKQKNGFSLPEEVAAMQYHLRLVMLSVLFQMPAADGSARTMTYGELCRLPHVIKMWDDYAKLPPLAGEAGCEWDADVAAGRAFLESDGIADVPVQIIAEIQMVLPLTCEVRHKMHELYKVARADTDKQLHLDFKTIADKEERKKQSTYDNATPLRRACVAGDIAQVAHRASLLMIADDGAALDNALDDAFVVACRHGQLEIIRMDLFMASRERVGWKAADEVIDKCPRPNLEVLETLIETPGWTWVNSDGSDAQHNHTLMHTACREGHTDVVSLLIKHGADINVPRLTDGCTALYIASQFGHTTIVDLLLAAGANHSLHHKKTDASPLYTAAESGHLWVVESLMSGGADMNHESQDRPPHLIAANNTHKDVVDLLMVEIDKQHAAKKQLAAQKKAQKSVDFEAAAAAKPGGGKPGGGGGGRGGGSSGRNRMAMQKKRRKQAEAEMKSGHVMHALAQQLKETFTQSGLTPERLFNTFEKDGDGEIGKPEFRRMLQSLGADIDTKTIDDLFTMLDKDAGGEGEIDVDEFKEWFESELPTFATGSQMNLVDKPDRRSIPLQGGRGRVISMQASKEVV
jgi:G3E family GTPase